MLSLISTLGGLLLSGMPKLLEFFQNKADQSHELALARLQNEMQLQLAQQGFLAQQRIEEIRTDQVAMETEARMTEAALAHDQKVIDKASRWVVNYIGTVRPTVTYLFVAEIIGINVAMIVYAWQHPGLISDFQSLMSFTTLLFSDEEMAMLGGILGFWFGNRAWSKK